MPNDFSGAERRQFKRLRVQFSVTYLVQKPMEVLMRVGEKKIETTMLDLSEGGMAIRTAVDIPLQTELTINFMLIYA
jgi:c-di-GMP-binding flagellar brake protein YcgR